MTRLVLASASPARLATLRAAGIDPAVVVSSVDEEAVLEAAQERFGALDPADAVLLLAQAKAHDVAARLDEHSSDQDISAAVLVLGCDSMLELDGEILGKPVDADDAVRRWRAMRGRTGVLHTGHWLVDAREPTVTEGREPNPGSLGAGRGGVLGATSSTTVHFADLSDEEVDAYVATGEPLAVAGAFTIDGLGGWFVTGIEGDHHGVVGLSLPLLRELLGQVDVTIPELWHRS